MSKKIKMKDGVYPNQEFEVYVDIDAVNFSSMKHIHTHFITHNTTRKYKHTCVHPHSHPHPLPHPR